jgi:tetratricopeptide (TPR) repeat protein
MWVAAAVVVAGGAAACWQVRPRPEPSAETAEEIPIPDPPWGEFEREAPEHVREYRERLEQVKRTSPPSAKDLARAYGELGEVFLTYDLPLAAVPCFRNASRWDGDDFRWPYLQAMGHFALTETADAAEAMRDAVARLRRDAAAGTEHLVAALCFLGEAAVRLNRAEEARGYFDEAVDLEPRCAFAYFKRGQLASHAGESESALDDFLKALSLYEGGRPAPICLAVAAEYRKLGQAAEAAKYQPRPDVDRLNFVVTYPNPLWAQVRKLNRRSSYVTKRAEALMAQGDDQAALQQLAEGLKVVPDAVPLRLLRAEVLLRLDQPAAAAAELEELRHQDRGGETGRRLLIQAYARSPETRSLAVREAEMWRAEEPAAVAPRMLLAALYFEGGEYPRARREFADAARAAPEEPGPRLGAVLSLCALGEYAAAGDEFQEGLKSFSDDADFRHHFARFLIACPDALCRDAQRGLSLVDELIREKSTFAMYETRACALAACGRWEEARESLAELIERCRTTSARRRLERIRESFAAGRPWEEPWPFAEIRQAGGAP